MYGQPSDFTYSGYSLATLIYFITEDFTESIDFQYSSSKVSYKAISEVITVNDDYTSSVNINYTRTTTTPLYGLVLVFIYPMGTGTIKQLCVYNHKFNSPITDTSFTIQMSFNIANGELNVS